MVLNRAYSFLNVKNIDSERRVLTGIATTPEVDRQGDIVEPLGVTFAKKIPLLLFHDSRQPVGTVSFRTPTRKGIEFEAHIPDITEPGTLHDRVTEAWQSVRAGLIAGVSIGFRALEDGVEIMKSGGIRFLKTEVLELSLVAIPANASAVIQTIKSLDTGLAANGTQADGESWQDKHSAGVTASTRVVKLLPTAQDRKMPKPITERIKEIEATRQAKSAEMESIQAKVNDEGRTKDPAERESFQALSQEIKSLDEELADMRDMEAINKSAAKPVAGKTADDGTSTRADRPVISVKDTMPPDIAFGAMVLCKAHSFLEFQKGHFITPLEVARARYPGNSLILSYFEQKAAVAGGTTTDSNFASALLPPAQVLESAFLEYLRPKTLIDRFGTTQNGVAIPSLQRVPFNVKVQSQTSGASAGWVGEGKGKPVTRFNTTSATLLFTKLAAISVITQELARFSRPGAEGLVRNELGKAVIAKADTSLIDPSVAEVSGVNPASITYGLTALSSAGVTAANVLTDVQALIAPFILAGYDISQLVLLMPNTLALTLSLMQNSLGQPSFPGMTVYGGTLAGIPVLASQYLASGASYGNMVVALSAENIALADDGNVSIDVSREASIEMSDAPANEVVTPTASAYSVSMFQSNSLAVRAEREINWKKLRSNAVVYMDDVNWGSVGSPY